MRIDDGVKEILEGHRVKIQSEGIKLAVLFSLLITGGYDNMGIIKELSKHLPPNLKTISKLLVSKQRRKRT